MIEEEIGMVAEARLFSAEQIQTKLKEQNNNCVLCTKPIKGKQKFEGDHIIPWANGGKTVMENLQVVHAVCHRKKK